MLIEAYITRPLPSLTASYHPPTVLPATPWFNSKRITASVPYLYLLYPYIYCFILSLHSGLCSNVTSSERPCLIAPPKIDLSIPNIISSLLSFLRLSLFHNTKHCLKFLLLIHFSLPYCLSHLSEEKLLSFFFRTDLSYL